MNTSDSLLLHVLAIAGGKIPKLDVAGSIPVSRSKFNFELIVAGQLDCAIRQLSFVGSYRAPLP